MLMLTWRCNYGGAVITSIGECFFYIPSGELETRSPKNALNTTTVEPRLSGPPLSGTSIIRLGSFLFNQIK